MKSNSSWNIWRREARAVLPTWIMVMLAIWLPGVTGMSFLHITSHERIPLGLLLGGAGMAMIVYGREFHERTVIWTLLQPLDRRMILVGKTTVLLVLLLPIIASAFFQEDGLPRLWKSDQLSTMGLWLALVLMSVAFWSILTRNLLATFVLTFAVPITLQLVVGSVLVWMWQHFGFTVDRAVMASDASIIILLILYTVGTGVAAVILWCRLELRGEAVAGPGMDVRWLNRLRPERRFRTRKTWVALMRKEFVLLRIVIWMAVFGLVLSSLYFATDRWLDSQSNRWSSSNATGVISLGAVLEWKDHLQLLGASAVAFYSALVPVLCGSLAFAEESFLGTREWHLCLAIGSNRQALIKMVTALGLSVSTGFFLPWMAAFPVFSVEVFHAGIDAVGQLLAMHLMLFGLAAWCGSWSRSTVNATVKSFLAVAAFVVLVQGFPSYANLRGALKGARIETVNWLDAAFAVALFAMLAAVSNNRLIRVPTRRWLWQGVGLVYLVLATLSMNLLMHLVSGT